jgi:hypothetical protein
MSMNRFVVPAGIALGVAGVAAVAFFNAVRPSPTKEALKTQAYRSTLAEMRLAVAAPIQQDRMTIVPVVSHREQTPTADYATLDEARKNGWVEITEGGSMEFNGVNVRNTGPKPLLLLAGDLVVGGHQDRVVAKDVVIQPGQSADIEVYCVEEGRSTGPSPVFEPSHVPVPHNVRRAALFARNQNQVWGSVNAFNGWAAAAPSTRTVNAGLKQAEVENYVQHHAQEITAQLVKIPNVVGYVVVVDGRPDVLEMFGNTALLKASAPRLLRGLSADAAVSKRSGGTPQQTAIEAFVGDSLRGSRRREANGQGFALYRVKTSSSIKGFEVYTTGKSKSGGEAIKYLVHGAYGAP